MALTDPGVGRKILDSGRGPNPPQVTLAAACNEGDVLGYSSGWKPALATTGSVIQGRVVALKAGAIGDKVPVSHDPLIGGYSGGTVGGYVYVAEGANNGQVTETAPSTAGDANTIIGLIVAADQVQFFLNARADSTA